MATPTITPEGLRALASTAGWATYLQAGARAPGPEYITIPKAEALKIADDWAGQIKAKIAAQDDRDRLEGELQARGVELDLAVADLKELERARDSFKDIAADLMIERDQAREALTKEKRKSEWFVGVARGLLRLARAQYKSLGFNPGMWRYRNARDFPWKDEAAALAALPSEARRLVEE